MKLNINFVLLFLFSLSFKFLVARLVFYPKSNFDVTIIGSVRFADGLGRLAIGFIENFHDKLKINYISTSGSGFIDNTDISETVKKVIQSNNKTPANVSILFDPLWYKNFNASELVPNSTIKIAYSMLEANTIPKQWVNILNNKFDAVAVPAPFLIKVYEKCGVKIPVFLMPHGIYISDFIKTPIRSSKTTIKERPFVFGMSAAFWPHKNHKLLLKAFLNKYANNKNFMLKIHGRFGDQKIINKLKKILKKYKINNVKIIVKSFTHKEYLEFMKSIDCYVLVSRGEGFSVTPREALALGKVCIVSNNTAHKVLCCTPYVIPVTSKIKTPADYRKQFGFFCGYNYSLNIKDIEKALKEAYKNFDKYTKISDQARSWVRQYEYKNLEKKYLNLVKPDRVIWSTKNIITNEYLMTNSKKLYKKYLILQSYYK